MDFAQIPRPPPPLTKGTLLLDVTPPGAILTLDGEVIAPANGFHRELPAGPHEIEISAESYVKAQQTVTIVAGETLRVRLQLAPVSAPPPSVTGTLVLDVTPSSAILRLDGKQVGSAKGFRQDLPEGSHVIEVSANGYVTVKRTVTITAGKTLPVSLPLAAIRQPPRPMPPPIATTPPVYAPAPIATTPPVHQSPSVAPLSAHPTIPLPPP